MLCEALDCDDVMLLIARGGRTLTPQQSLELDGHLRGCTACAALASDAETAADSPAAEGGDRLDPGVADPASFAIQGEIAAGGMGRISRAVDRRLGRTIAIKEALSESFRPRFEREAVITARLQHPAIVPIYEVGAWPDGALFYTMRLVKGRDLAEAITRAGDLLERLALLPNLLAVTDALAYAHSEGVIHRDLKPHNVLLGEFGETVVIDWGLAKRLDLDGDGDPGDAPAPDDRQAIESARLTRVGSVIGTPAFMAPEQAAGEPVDERSDVYALGAMLYTLLAGQPPYLDVFPRMRGDVLIDVVLQRDATPIAELVDGAPADLIAIADRAMARDPADRYDTAMEMADELRRFQAGQLIASRDYGVAERLGRWVARHRAAVSVAAIAAVILGAVGVMAVRDIARSRDAERDARGVAERARDDAEARAAELVFAQARSALASDPTRALAWLKRYPPGGPSAGGAALLAAEAAQRGVAEWVFTAPGNETATLFFTPDDRELAAAADDAPARVWSLARGESRDLAIHGATLAFDAARDRYVGAAVGQAALQFEPRAGPASISATSDGFTPLFDLAFEPGRQLAAIELDNERIGLWRGATDRFERLEATGGVIGFVGSRLLVLDAARLELWPVDGGERAEIRPAATALYDAPMYTLHDSPPAFALHDSDSVKAIDGVLLWTEGRDAMIRLLAGSRSETAAFSRDGAQLAVGTLAGEIAVFDTATATEICRWRGPAAASALIYLGDKREVAAGFADGAVIIASDCGARERALRGHTAEVLELAATSTGDRVASASADQTVRVYRRGAGPLAAVALEPSFANDHCKEPVEAFEYDDFRLLSCIGVDGLLRIDRASGAVTELLEDEALDELSGDGLAALGYHAGRTVVIAGGRRTPVSFDRDDSSSISHDGAVAASGGPGGTGVWNVATGERLHALPPSDLTAIAPDASAILVDRADGLALIDLSGDSPATIATHPAHARINAHVAWSARSRAVGVEIGDAVVLHYDRDSDRWTRLESDTDYSNFALSPDGARIGGIADSGLLFWDVATGAYHRAPIGVILVPDQVRFTGAAEFSVIGTETIARARFPRFDSAAIERLTRAVVDERGALSSR